ncbi:RNA repair transcriptional activator RtcR [Pleionea litopenaei]|uniref:RNA repair transcriptional activator RtcR n=1 Tax=Pleionea litopenaei TaxID=3070815 RepID=A0AA51RW70_9GAMM|nr:RNA repair transcriptional activator RtcR [Pleionea sp. HL-JVS1]WMS88911.1 RNA repair transcriptional activator RtcR [Pleionea sp. HL-JVS1]
MPNIAVSLLGVQKDFVGKRIDRWSKWRPNVSLCSHDDLPIDELHLLAENHSMTLANQVIGDIETVSPNTKVILHKLNFNDPWDFEEVYAKLFDWCQAFSFNTDKNDYLFHITTGTHVVQICSFLLTESRHFPGRLVQTSPDNKNANRSVGRIHTIDLDLSKYDQLSTRFDIEHAEGKEVLKGGIATKNLAFNTMIGEIETVAVRSKDPLLLTGPTGAGKSQLAGRIYQLKKKRSLVSGPLIAVNCATLKGENAMAALFGHTKGAFTGALKAREGYLLSANKGVLFLDEIGELGLEEQAMLLTAIEQKHFHPVGSDQLVTSDFQLIVGTNRDLRASVQSGEFREDLLARINLWTYQLPALKDRREDIPANLDYELDRYAAAQGQRIQFNKEAKQRFLDFATSPEAVWHGNFRDLSSAVTRLCTLADSSRISEDQVCLEIERLKHSWQLHQPSDQLKVLELFLTQEQIEAIDPFDRLQLNYVLNVCMQHKSLASAGRELFAVSRKQKSKPNDSSRLQKYLLKYTIKWESISEQQTIGLTQ